MNKFGVVLDVIRIIDENNSPRDALERRPEKLVYRDREADWFELRMIEEGRRRVFEDCTWLSVNACLVDGEREPVETFRRRLVRQLPDYLSYEEFCSRFSDMIDERYESSFKGAE